MNAVPILLLLFVGPLHMFTFALLSITSKEVSEETGYDRQMNEHTQ